MLLADGTPSSRCGAIQGYRNNERYQAPGLVCGPPGFAPPLTSQSTTVQGESPGLQGADFTSD